MTDGRAARTAMNREQLLRKLDRAWTEFKESYASLSDARLTAPGVVGDWSVKDIIAHVTWWEEEALKYLPLIIKAGTPPRYSTHYGGINAFNALMTDRKHDLSLADVLRQQELVHHQLIDYLQSVPEEHFIRETRFRHRLRLDTYSHYPEHTKAIREWRGQSA
jgi:Protein of unknown function (DUF1706)